MTFSTSAYSTSRPCCSAYLCRPRGTWTQRLNRPISGRTLYGLWSSYSVMVGTFPVLRTILAQSLNRLSRETSYPQPEPVNPLSMSARVYDPKNLRMAPMLMAGKRLPNSGWLGAPSNFLAHSLMAAIISCFDTITSLNKNSHLAGVAVGSVLLALTCKWQSTAATRTPMESREVVSYSRPC